MGRDKNYLPIDNQTFLERIGAELRQSGASLFDELLLSTGTSESLSLNGFTNVPDLYPDSGAIGGIYSALMACRSEGLFVVCCDMPLFKHGLAEYILSYAGNDTNVIILSDRNGRVHPLCGYYSKSTMPVLKKQILQGDFRMRNALRELRVKEVSLKHSVYPDETVANINTPEEYALLLKKTLPPPVIAVSGIKNSGKTTLLAGIIPLLHQAGYNIAVVKHDGHDFLPDVPGTDSFLLRQAGAANVAVYSDYRYMLTKSCQGTALEELLPCFPEADLVLYEGGKHSPYPKIEVLREAVSAASVCDPSTLLCLCTDTAVRLNNVPTVSPDDYSAICDIIANYLNNRY